MLSFNECKKILNKNGEKYTDKQVQEINEFIDMLADIVVTNNLISKTQKENGRSGNNAKSIE